MFLPFNEKRLDEEMEVHTRHVDADVLRLGDETLMARPEAELVQRLASARLTVPRLDFHAMTLSPGTTLRTSTTASGKQIEVKTVIYRVPYHGLPVFLQCWSSTRSITGGRHYFFEQGSLCFEILRGQRTPEEVNAERDERLNYLREYLPVVAHAVAAFNADLADRALRRIQDRKNEIAADAAFFEALHATNQPPKP
jgi:hypothetical protein